MNKEAYIIGGGISLKGFDFSRLKDKTTIAVNKSYPYVPNLDYFITMDFTALRKIKSIEKSSPTKVFIANFAKFYLQERDGKIVDTRFDLVYDLINFNMIIKSYKTDGIGLKFNDFRNGDNSGFCALQFAILMGFNPIYLLGIDLKVDKETHFHGGYNQDKKSFQKKLDSYYEYFIQGIKELKEKRPDIKMYSCSDISKLNNLLEYKEI